MTIDDTRLRLDGIYKQNDQGQLMLRAKIPAGVLSSEQANKLAELADRHAGGRVHLTTRGSIEFHDLDATALPEVTRGLAAVGLTSRGACGGAVRGISCSSTFGDNFDQAQSLARRLHRHFAGNPYFEGLPKKFKISVDGSYRRSRHLIQDVGLVVSSLTASRAGYDLWIAGGLGREPQAAILYREAVPEPQVIPVIEAVIRAYRNHGEKGKRLKHLLNRVGEAELRRLIGEESAAPPEEQIDNGLGQTLSPPSSASAAAPVTVPVFAGELASRDLRALGELAGRLSLGVLALTADQDIAFLPPDRATAEQLKLELAAAGFLNDAPEQRVVFRICPGSHECRMGLAPTRDIAREIIAALPEDKREATWAISGCPNSCSQPQLADYGIIARKLTRNEDGDRSPRFELTRRNGDGLGEAVAVDLDLAQLKGVIGQPGENRPPA